MINKVYNCVYENPPQELDTALLSDALYKLKLYPNRPCTVNLDTIVGDKYKFLSVSVKKSGSNLHVKILQYLNFDEAQAAFKGEPSILKRITDFVNRELPNLNKKDQPQAIPPCPPTLRENSEVVNAFKFIYENPPEGLDCSALSNILNREKIDINPKVLASYNKHVIEHGKYKFIRVHVRKSGDNDVDVNVKVVFYLNFEEVQATFKDDPSFLQAAIKFMNENQLSIPNKQEQPQVIPPSSLQTLINCNGVTVKLSRELISGMNGERVSDHQIPLSTLKTCIEKKSKKLKKEINNKKRLDFYFNAINDTSSQILNLVLSPDPTHQMWHAITAYYMPRSSVKARLNLTDTQFEEWKKNLPRA